MSGEKKDDFRETGDYTLESILAEYKSDAFIKGQKKTPKPTLDEAAAEIVRGSESESKPQPIPKLKPQTVQIPAPPPAKEEILPVAQEPTKPLPMIDIPFESAPTAEEPLPPQQEERAKKQRFRHKKQAKNLDIISTEIADSDPQATDYQSYADRDRMNLHAHLAKDIEQIPELEKTPGSGTFSRFLQRLFPQPAPDTEEKPPRSIETEEGRYDDDAFTEDDMGLREAVICYNRGLKRMQLRGWAAIALSLFMLLITFMGEAGRITEQTWQLAGALLFLQLTAMLLTLDVIVTGVTDLFRRRFGMEGLLVFASLGAVFDAIRVMRAGAADFGLPFSAVVVFALGCAMLGLRATRNAMRIGLHTAAMGKNPNVLTSKFREEGEAAGHIILKTKSGTAGFIKKMQQMDFAEYLYRIVAPLLLAMSIVFAFFAAWGGAEGGEAGQFIRNFSAMTAVSASFTALLAYGLPYAMLSRKLMKNGAAIAGWGGAAEIAEAAGIALTDGDVFPRGTVKLSGVHVVRKTDTQRVIAYTASLLVAFGSGVADVFAELMYSQKFSFYPVKDLACYEGGGVGAMVNGEEVLVGSAAFMNLMGYRLPQNLSIPNAVYTAMGGNLAGVFAIDYVPTNAVQDAMTTLLDTKINPLFAMRDFNVTPQMLRNKFHIKTDEIEPLTYETRCSLSATRSEKGAKPFAVLCREGLDPLADVLIGGKRLRRIVQFNTIFSLLWSVMGLLLLLSFSWAGAHETASVANLFTYMGAGLFVIGVLSRSVLLD